PDKLFPAGAWSRPPVADFPLRAARELPLGATIGYRSSAWMPRAERRKRRFGRVETRFYSMKWFKRITFFVVGLAILLALVTVGAYVFGVRGTPDWLERPVISAEQRAAAANRMDQKILETLSQVQEMYAYDRGAQSRPA